MKSTKLLNRVLESPTIMTWLSYSTKALSLFGILPLILKQFSPEDIVLWYLFSTIIAMQSLADFGFRQTFSRFISYAYTGGGSKFPDDNRSAKPEIFQMHDIVSTMRHIYIPLTAFVFVLMITVGTWFLYHPIQGTADVFSSWVSWGIIVVISCISFYGKLYMNFLEGLNKVALVRRVETFTSLGSIICSIGVLIVAPTLLNLIIVNQFWLLVSTYRDYFLCRRVEGNLYSQVSEPIPFDKDLFLKIWHPAWRSGISGLMSIGLTNLTGLVYAQVGSTAAVASYLLALRIITQVRDISMAPFYSKIPQLAMLRARDDVASVLKLAKRGMILSHSFFVIGIVLVGVFSNTFLKAIGSDVQFVGPELWALLSLAFFIHRFGAMHMQVYISTNHIISHIADGVSGIIYICISLLLIKSCGIYAIPLGMMAGYMGFYAWYAARYSYKSLNVTFWTFEKGASIVPLLVIILFVTITSYLNFR